MADIELVRLTRSARTTHCPFKGDASYWTISLAGDRGKDTMWAYENPYDEMLPIAGHSAFDPARVSIAASAA